MFAKKIVVLIIFFCPLLLKAQESAKNNSTEAKRLLMQKKLKKNTYADDEIKLAKLTSAISNKIQSNNELIRKKYDLFNMLSNSSAKNKLQQDIDSLFKVHEKLVSQLTIVQLNFIRNNPSSYLSLDGLTSKLKNSAELPYDTIESLFNNLNKNIQNSTDGKKFKLLLVDKKKSGVGSLANDFKVRDINNKEISLSDFRNKKYVLLDFWASWCKPCREDMPFLKKIYKVYREKDLEIIGISKDDDLSSWKKAVEMDSTQNWKQISVPLNIQDKDISAITNKYFVYGIPVKILINKEGIIIGRWTGGGEENMGELRKLLNKVLDKL